MKWKRLGSSALALVLVCCLIFNMMVVPAKAVGGGLAAAEIVKASTVSFNPYVVGAACLIALGVWAAAELGAFEELSARASLHLLDQKLTNSRGEVDVLQTVNAAGEKAFYVAGDILESVRGWLFQSGAVTVNALDLNLVSGLTVPGWALAEASAAAYSALVYTGPTSAGAPNNCYVVYSNESPLVIKSTASNGAGVYIGTKSSSAKLYLYSCLHTSITYFTVFTGKAAESNSATKIYSNQSFGLSDVVRLGTSLDVSIGNVPTSYIDGTSALDWAPEYANRQLRVINTGGGSNPDGGGDGDPKWKWYAPIVLGTVAGLMTQVQSDQWQGNKLDDVPEYEVIQDYDIVDNPDIDGMPGIEIKPVTVPEVDPTPDPGVDPEPGPGTDGEVITGTFADTAVGSFINALINALWTPIRWLGEPVYRLGEYVGKIVRGEISVPEAWQQLLSSVVSNPIVSAIQKIISGEITLPQALSLGLSEIVSLITSIAGPVVGAIPETLAEIASWCINLPQTLAGLFTSVIVEPLLAGLSYMFVPSADYLSAKVDAIRAEFGFADGVIAGAEMIRDMFSGLDPEPPVIWIDLNASRGSYDIGDKVKFLDMTLYAEYKPTVDKLLSALIWIVFIWQTFKRLPGIISGVPGDFVMDGIHVLGLEDRLPSRNAAYEIQRRDLRDQIRRGK